MSKRKVLAGPCSLQRLSSRILPGLFQLLVALGIPWLEVTVEVSTSLSQCPLHVSSRAPLSFLLYEQQSLAIGPALHLGRPHLEIPNLITEQRPSVMVTFTGPGAETWIYLWEVKVQPSTVSSITIIQIFLKLPSFVLFCFHR